MWIQNEHWYKNLIFYFHANSTDIGQCVQIAESFSHFFKAHVILIEYPGYGTYKKQKISQKQLFKDSEVIYRFVLRELNFDPNNIMVVGRSLGSAVAINLCSKFKSKALILISPFQSIRKVVKDKFGPLSFCVKNILCNDKAIQNVKCPVLIIHGV